MATTPNRRTHVTIDSPQWAVNEPVVFFEYEGVELAGDDQALTENVAYQPGQGWALTTYNFVQSLTHETDVDDAGTLLPSNGKLYVAADGDSGFSEVPMQRWHSELSGIPQGVQRTSGDQYLQKVVAAGSSFNVELTADRASFPAPDDANDTVPLDRVAISTDDHTPNELITFSFILPGGMHRGRLIRVYFTGIPGTTFTDYLSAQNGRGNYCLTLMGDGNSLLHERMSDGSWKQRTTIGWAKSSDLTKRCLHSIRIHSDAKKDPNDPTKWIGTRLRFRFEALDVSTIGRTLESSAKLAVNAARGADATGDWVEWKIPQYEKSQPWASKIRIDVRRDIRAMFSIKKSAFHPSGTLRTRTIALPQTPGNVAYAEGNDMSLYFSWFGDIPTGSQIDVQVYDATTDVALGSAGAEAHYKTWGYQGFTLVPGITHYYAIITFSSADGTVGPSITSGRFSRNALLSRTAITPSIPSKVLRVSITGQDADPSHETAGVVIDDALGECSVLKLRSGMPIRIDTEYNRLDSSLRSVLFQGYVAKAQKQRRAPGDASHVVNDRSRYTLKCAGEWQRLTEARSPVTVSLLNVDKDTGSSDSDGVKGPKVTDVVRFLLSISGCPASRIDVPDINLRLIGDGQTSFMLEQYSPTLPIIIELVRDYLGGYLIFDANATNGGSASDYDGCWRVRFAPRPDPILGYRNLISFSTGGSGGVATAHYPDLTGTYGQTIKQTFIRKGSLHSFVEPPEFNHLVVTGVGASNLGSTPNKHDAVALEQHWYNWKSATFLPTQGDVGKPPAEDPTHPDWLGRVVTAYICDTMLTTKEAVAFRLRRTADMAGHARKVVQFEAPVVLITDSSDSLQCRPRKPQFGDMVLIDGAQFVVQSCNIDYSKSKFSHAFYECASVPGLSDYSAASLARD